jgi:hypothetical protein
MAKQTKEADPAVVDGIILDTTGIDNGLTERAKRYVFWYSFPGTDCYQHKTKAAIQAGYAKKNAVSTGYKLSKNPVIKRETERLLKEYVTESVNSLYRKYTGTLEARAFFDPAEFISGAKFKPISEIDPDKRIAVEQLIADRDGVITAFQFGSRQAALREIRELYAQQNPGINGNAYDAEETKEIIMERITIRQQRRTKQAAEFDDDIVIAPLETMREEL